MDKSVKFLCINNCYVLYVLLWIKYWLMWFESLLNFILLKSKKIPNISGIWVLSICLSVCLSVCLSIYLSIYRLVTYWCSSICIADCSESVSSLSLLQSVKVDWAHCIRSNCKDYWAEQSAPALKERISRGEGGGVRSFSTADTRSLHTATCH